MHVIGISCHDLIFFGKGPEYGPAIHYFSSKIWGSQPDSGNIRHYRQCHNGEKTDTWTLLVLVQVACTILKVGTRN